MHFYYFFWDRALVYRQAFLLLWHYVKKRKDEAGQPSFELIN